MFFGTKDQIVLLSLSALVLHVALVVAEQDVKIEVKDNDLGGGYTDAATGQPITLEPESEEKKDLNEDKDGSTDDDAPDFGAEPDFGSPNFDRHMRQTISEEFGDPVPEEYTGKAYYYYYFKTHDDDKNNKLDRKELLKALIHLVLPGSNYQNYNRGGEPREPDGDYGISWEIELICRDSADRIIRKDDKNKDGFLDAIEYQDGKSRGIKAIKKSIDKQLQEHGARGRFY